MKERITGCVVGLLLLSFAGAHNGFATLAWRESLGGYTVSVLFHAADAEQAQLLVQLSEGQQAAPATTEVSTEIRLGDASVYEGEVPFAGNGSADGRTFYRGYLLTLPLSEEGMYEIDLNVTGPLGAATASYFARSQQGSVSVLEYVPSLLLLLVCLGGVALLFVPVKRPAKRKDVRVKRLTMLLLPSLFTLTSLSQAQGLTDWLSRISNTEEHLIHREQVGSYLVNGDGQRLIGKSYLKLDIREDGTRIPTDSTVRVDATLYHGGGQSRSSYTPEFDGRYFVIDPLELEGAENWSWNDNGWLELDISIDGPAGEATGEVGFPVYPPKPEAGTLFRIVNVGLPFVLLGLFVLVYRVTGTRLRRTAPSS